MPRSYRWPLLIALVGSVLALEAILPGAPAQADVAAQRAQPTLRRGAQGPAVVALQRRLNIWRAQTPRPAVPLLRVDGDFGPATERVVMAFQRRAGLRVTGVVEATTWARLPPDPAAPPPSPERQLATAGPAVVAPRTPTPARTTRVPARPSVTPTRAPSAQPASTPTPAANRGARGVTIMSHRSDTVTAALVIVGELRNDTTSSVRAVVVSAHLYDARGAAIGMTRGGAAVAVLQPGQRSPFRIVIAGPPAGWASYQLQGQGQTTSEQPVRDLRVRVSSDRDANGAEGREIVGDVRNDTGERLRAVELIATLYDARGQVVGMSTAYATYEALGPGQSAAFRLFLMRVNGAVRYELQAQAQRAR